MFRTVEDFLKAYDQATQSTLKIFGQLSDPILGRAVAPGHRTLGQIAWHITVSVGEMMGRTGLKLETIDHQAPPPASAAEIVAAYRKVTAELAEAVKYGWKDETLLTLDDMYGEKWPRGLTLYILIEHEVHHRGQMTVLLRQAGQTVPGIMGPSKEEWALFGQQPPPY